MYIEKCIKICEIKQVKCYSCHSNYCDLELELGILTMSSLVVSPRYLKKDFATLGLLKLHINIYLNYGTLLFPV